MGARHCAKCRHIHWDAGRAGQTYHGPPAPHRKASDIDLREMAAHVIQKSITVRWIPSHCQLSDARDAQQQVDILRNNEVDRLAKLATTLPLTLFTPTSPSSISLGGTEAPTPAKEWIAALRPYPTHPGVHWVTWLPLRARRRQAWLQWLWGSIRWQGCSPPLKKAKVHC